MAWEPWFRHDSVKIATTHDEGNSITYISCSEEDLEEKPTILQCSICGTVTTRSSGICTACVNSHANR